MKTHTFLFHPNTYLKAFISFSHYPHTCPYCSYKKIWMPPTADFTIHTSIALHGPPADSRNNLPFPKSKNVESDARKSELLPNGLRWHIRAAMPEAVRYQLGSMPRGRQKFLPRNPRPHWLSKRGPKLTTPCDKIISVIYRVEKDPVSLIFKYTVLLTIHCTRGITQKDLCTGCWASESFTQVGQA